MKTELSDEEFQDFTGRIVVALSQSPVPIDAAFIEAMSDLFANQMGIRLIGNLRTAVLRRVQHLVCHSRPYSFSVFLRNIALGLMRFGNGKQAIPTGIAIVGIF